MQETTEEEEEAENQTSGEWETDRDEFWLERLGFGFLHNRPDQHKNNCTVCEDADLEGGVFQHQAEWSRLRFQLGVCMPATVLPQ